MRKIRLLLIVAGVLVASAVVAVGIYANEDRRIAEGDRAQALQATHALETSMQATVFSLRGVAGLFEASEFVSSAEFRAFATPLFTEHRSLVSVTWLPQIGHDGRRAHERLTGRPITEGPATARRTADVRPSYFPVTYLVTDARQPLRGFDAASDPVRLRAIELATQRSSAQATPPLPLASSGKPGIVIYQPVFAAVPAPATGAARERALQGIVAGSYRVDALVASLQRSVAPGTVLQVRQGDKLISGPPRLADAQTASMPAVGRTWTVRASTNQSPSLVLPAAVLLTGAALALLIALMLRQAFTRERYALAMVDERMSERDAAQYELEGARATAQGLASQQSALRRVATSIAAEASLPDVCETIRSELMQLLDAEDAVVVRHHDGSIPASGAADASPLDAGACWLTDDAGADRVIFRSAIRTGDRIWGTVALLNPVGFAPDAVGSHLRDFADLAAVAVGNAEARRELAVRASTDGLTGLNNRRTFDECLREEISRAIRYKRPLSLAIIDVDHFKQVNDRHGHQAGDAVLAEVAQQLRSLARSGDLVARIGGEEFAWIMPETSTDLAHIAAERARTAVAATDRGDSRLTVSIGLADLAEVPTPDALYGRADAALLTAKRCGRNRTVTHEPAHPPGSPGRAVAGPAAA